MFVQVNSFIKWLIINKERSKSEKKEKGEKTQYKKRRTISKYVKLLI